MKILFLTLGSIYSISQRGIYNDLMREFVNRGHEPYIVTIAERRTGLKEEVLEEQGIRMLRVKTLNIRKSNIIEKGIGTLLIESQYKKAIIRHWGDINFDLCLYSTPPITFNKIIEWQKNKGVKTYLMLKDIFPQNAVDLSMMKPGSILWRYFRKKEERLYQISDRIGCMSPANCEYVIKNNPSVEQNKVELCPNSIQLSSNLPKLTQIEKSKMMQKYGFKPDIPLFIYGGNLGRPQGIDYLIKALDHVRDRNDVQFCIVGSGTESHKLYEWVNDNKPTNIKVMDALPKEDYDLFVSSADVGLIFLDPHFTIPNFPSRLLSYLENRMPVLLATDVNTDMGRIAETEGFGLWAKTDDTENILLNIDKLASDEELRKQMGQRGFQYLLNNYTVDKTADIILSSQSR